MNKFILLILLLCGTLSFSQKAYDFKEAEMRSRRLVYTNPDSALVVIKKTLAQKGAIHDTVYGNTYSLYGIYFGMTGNPDSSVYYFKKSLEYIDDFPRNKSRSILNLAIAYRNKGEYQTSIKYLNDAIAIHKKIDNPVGVAMAYGELASNYNYMNEYDKSIDYLLKAISILKSKNNTKQLVAVKQKLANTYLKKENYKFAADLYKECLPEFLAIGSDKNYYLTLANLAEAYIHMEQFTNARNALKEAAAGLEKFGDKELLGITYSKTGNLERQLKNPAMAIKYYGKALNYLLASKSPNIVRIGAEYIDLLNENKEYTKAKEIIGLVSRASKIEAASKLDRIIYQKAAAATFSGTQDDKNAIDAYKQTIVMMDSLALNDKEKAIQEVQAKFQTELQREKNLALEGRNKALRETLDAEKKLLWLYILASIAVIIVILLFLRGYRLRNKLQSEKIKSVEAEKSLIEQQREYEQEINNSQLERIGEKQRELTSMALRMANYQDSLNTIIEKCDTGAITKVTDIKNELQQLIKSTDYWKQFETRFNGLHPDFNNNLTSRFPKLTKNDLEFCSLLKLNLTNKEIASLLQISHESAITKKYRIKKKMEINDDDEFEKAIGEL